MRKCKIILGTAGWGIRASFEESSQILDDFLEHGGRLIDSSTNYPIDKSFSFGQTLEVFSQKASIQTAKFLVKVGAATNSGCADQLLSPSYLDLSHKFLRKKLGDTYFGIGVHFDSRTDSEDIKATCSKLIELASDDLRIGLSGMSSPNSYAAHLTRITSPILLQINIAKTSIQKVIELRELFPRVEIYGYGLLGGISNKSALKDTHVAAPPSLYSESLLNKMSLAKSSLDLDGLIIGPSSVKQLHQYFEAINRQGCDFEF